MIGLGQPERHGSRSVQCPGDELPLLLRRAEVPKDQNHRMIPNDGMLVLQVVVQPQSLARQVLADHGHPQIRPVLAAVLLGQSKSIVTRTIGTPSSLAQQSLPLRSRQATVGEIRTSPFPPVIKKP